MSVIEKTATSIVKRFWEDFLNRGDLNTGKEILPPDYYQNEIQYMQGVHAAFPDAHWDIEEMITEGNAVATRYIWSGTHLGPWAGVPATGKQIKMAGMWFHHVENGQLRFEEYGVLDWLGFYQQLGVVSRDIP